MKFTNKDFASSRLTLTRPLRTKVFHDRISLTPPPPQVFDAHLLEMRRYEEG